MNIEITRLRAQVFALETLVVMLVGALCTGNMTSEDSLRTAMQEGAESLLQTHPTGSSAEEGDLQMAEYQEAWAALTLKLLPPDSATASDG